MKLKLIIVMLAVFSSSTMKAQIDGTVNPLGLLFSHPSVGVDIALSNSFSVEGIAGIRWADGIFAREDDYDRFRIPLTLVGKYYFNPEMGADKFYASFWGRFVNVNVNYGANSGFSNYTRSRVGVGVGAGFKMVSNSGIVFDIGAGLGRKIFENLNYREPNLTQEPLVLIDLMVLTRLSIGYRFGTK